jgi:hypothetical protein
MGFKRPFIPLTPPASEEADAELAMLQVNRGEMAPDGRVINPTRVHVVFRATDPETGRYRDDLAAEPVPMMEDQPYHWDPEMASIMTFMRRMLIKSKFILEVDEAAGITAEDVERAARYLAPLTQAGIAAPTLEQWGPAVMGYYFQRLQTPPPSEEESQDRVIVAGDGGVGTTN